MLRLLRVVSELFIPLAIVFIVLLGYIKGESVFEVFVDGAKQGFAIGVKIIPHLVAMLVALRMLKGSGAIALFEELFSPLMGLVDIPAEVLPLALIRPLSGSGALAMTAEIFAEYGPDSLIGLIASTIQGSTETTLYIITVYFGAVGIKNARYAPLVGFAADFMGFVASAVFCRIMMG